MSFDRTIFEDNTVYKLAKKFKHIFLSFYQCYLKGESIRLYKNRGSQLMEIPIDICINALGFSYGGQGWHYLTALLKEYEGNNKLTPENSVLNKFHNLYQPESFFELIKHKGEDIKFRPPIGIYPWASFYVKESKRGGKEKDLKLTRFCGPSDFKLIKRDFNLAINVYKDIKKRGYRPWLNESGFVTGSFLMKENGERRFMVLDGNHRVAVLSVLGYESVTVRYADACYPEIKESDVNEWYYVKSGQCSKDDALAYFNAYFELNGLERARELGLIESG